MQEFDKNCFKFVCSFIVSHLLSLLGETHAFFKWDLRTYTENIQNMPKIGSCFTKF